jgi:hypothetical protein
MSLAHLHEEGFEMPTHATDDVPATHVGETRTSPAAAGGLVGDRAVGDLVGGVRDALAIPPTAWGRSIFGSVRSTLPMRHSEYGLAYSWRVLRMARYVADVTIPSMPVRAPEWFPEPLAPFFWHPSRVRQRPDHNDSWTSHPHESWLFINGIMTDDALAQMNAAYLADLFHRPITLIENSTDGLVEDLLECARERSFGRNAEATETAFPTIYDALKDPEKRRVVVIAHSQGTIIASAVLRLLALVYQGAGDRSVVARDPQAAREAAQDAGVRLDPTDFEPLDRDELGKLELYCFANCATQMRYVDRTAAGPLPWIESYGNEYDIVARLGALAPHPRRRGVVIDGPIFERQGAGGHLLNQHYLRPIDQRQRGEGHKCGPVDTTATPFVLVNRADHPDSTQPQLYRYLNGGSPVTRRGHLSRLPARQP